jgi:hypothetical protein
MLGTLQTRTEFLHRTLRGDVRLLAEFLVPMLHGFKRVLICKIKSQHTAFSAAVKRLADRLKSLLAGSVPDLHLFPQRYAG